MGLAALLGVDVSWSKESGCCPDCLADLPDHWTSDLYRYCEHRAAVSQWDDKRQAWGIVRRVGRWRAKLMLARITRRIELEARQHGMTVEALDKLLTWNRATKRSPHQEPRRPAPWRAVEGAG